MTTWELRHKALYIHVRVYSNCGSRLSLHLINVSVCKIVSTDCKLDGFFSVHPQQTRPWLL